MFGMEVCRGRRSDASLTPFLCFSCRRLSRRLSPPASPSAPAEEVRGEVLDGRPCDLAVAAHGIPDEGRERGVLGDPLHGAVALQRVLVQVDVVHEGRRRGHVLQQGAESGLAGEGGGQSC